MEKLSVSPTQPLVTYLGIMIRGFTPTNIECCRTIKDDQKIRPKLLQLLIIVVFTHMSSFEIEKW